MRRYRDSGQSVQETTDGGFIIAGTTWRFGGRFSDLLLIKTDGNGNKIWWKTFGRNDVDWGQSVQETTDGGFIITGTTWGSEVRGSEVYLVKTDANGTEVWSKTFGGSRKDQGESVCQTADGGYIITGQTSSFGAGKEDVYLIKTDANGNEMWSRTFGGSGNDSGKSVQQTIDGGYIITGQTDSFGVGKGDVYLIKTNADGKEVWSHTFGGRYRDWGASVRQTVGGGYIIAGTTRGPGSRHNDVYLIKADADGREIWSRTLGGVHGDYGRSVQQAKDGGFIIAGNAWPFGKIGTSEVCLIRTDIHGREIWTKTFGGRGFDYGHSVCQTSDGGYIVVGTTSDSGSGETYVFLIKARANGEEAWRKRLE